VEKAVYRQRGKEQADENGMNPPNRQVHGLSGWNGQAREKAAIDQPAYG
jgi:hypothetical protein